MELVAIGKISRPIGVHGEVKVIPLTSHADRFIGLKSVWIGASPETVVQHNVVATRFLFRDVALQLADIGSVNLARKLQNKYIFVTREQAIQPPDGSYFIDDIIGCKVLTESGKYIGQINDIYSLPASDVWVVKHQNKEILIPAVKAIVKNVDIKERCVTIIALEGLVD